MSQIVGLVVLPNDGRPGNSRTRTDGILSSRPVIFSSCPTSRNERRGRTTFCRPVPSRALVSPPAGPYGGPGRLRTLVLSLPPSDPTILSVLASDSTVLSFPPSDSTVLPVLASVSTRIREFQIPLEDIFGNDLPEVLDPKDSIIFSLRELEAHVIGSLQETTWS